MAEEEELETLKAQLAQLKAWREGVLEGKKTAEVVVRSPVDRKIKRFSGKPEETVNWIEDARCAIQGLSQEDGVAYIYRHLEGVAREEVKLYPESARNTPKKLFEILATAFKDKRSDVQLKRAMYERLQKPGESLRSYSRALLDLSQKLENSVSSKERELMLCEIFSDNVQEKYLRVELKKQLRKIPGISFVDLREIALNISEEDEVRQGSLEETEGVHKVGSMVMAGESVSQGTAGMSSPGMSRLELQMGQLMEMQSQMLDCFRKLMVTTQGKGPRGNQHAGSEMTSPVTAPEQERAYQDSASRLSRNPVTSGETDIQQKAPGEWRGSS